MSPGRGIIINHIDYWAEAFRDPTIEGHEIAVRYDPFDIGIAYAFVKNRWMECCSEHHLVLKDRSEKEVMLASKEVRRRRQLHSQERFTLTARKLADFLGSAEAEKSVSYSVCVTAASQSKQLHLNCLRRSADQSLPGCAWKAFVGAVVGPEATAVCRTSDGSHLSRNRTILTAAQRFRTFTVAHPQRKRGAEDIGQVKGQSFGDRGP